MITMANIKFTRIAALGISAALMFALGACSQDQEVPSTPKVVATEAPIEEPTPSEKVSPSEETQAGEKDTEVAEEPMTEEELLTEYENDPRWFSAEGMDQIFIPSTLGKAYEEADVKAAVLANLQTLADGGYHNTQLLMARDMNAEEDQELMVAAVLSMEDKYGAELFNSLVDQASGKKEISGLEVFMPTVQPNGLIANLGGKDVFLAKGAALECEMPNFPMPQLNDADEITIFNVIRCEADTADGKTFIVEREVVTDMVERHAGWAIRTGSFDTLSATVEG